MPQPLSSLSLSRGWVTRSITQTTALSPSRPTHGSLAGNQLCGLDYRGLGTYTAEGITKLCEGLKGSAVTSLECAARPESVRFYVSAR